jgi:two-component system OmpR family response regulator
MTSAPQLLVVDDDASIRDALAEYLTRHGFAVRLAGDGREMDAALAEGRPDLLILDLMMPGEDGLSIARRLSGKLPILMLSAMSDTSDRIVGLEMGADDYLPKPFEPRELLARVRSLLRRGEAGASKSAFRGHRFAGWTLDHEAQLLLDPEGRNVQLTAGDYALLTVFLERPRQILTRDQLLNLTQGPLTESFDRAVDLAVSRLRRRLHRPGEDELIETVRGYGYRFSAKVVRQ